MALALAERQNGVVINADSAQVYRDLQVVTARPAPEEEARAPHRLYGYRDGAAPCSAAGWAADAARSIRQAHQEGRLPILVGGTGLYIRTLLEGIAPVPPIDPAIRSQVRALEVADAHAALAREDLEAAARLRPTDTTRVARALEVVRSTGRALGYWQKEKQGGIGSEVAVRALILLPPRDWLYARCDARFERMLSDEGVAEVRALLARGLDPALPVMRAIGVAEITSYVGGTLGYEDTLRAGQTATRQYAKRQYTWFSRQPPLEWPRFSEALEGAAVAKAIAAFAA